MVQSSRGSKFNVSVANTFVDIREIRGFYGFAVSKFDGLCPFQVSGFYGFAVSRFQVVVANLIQKFSYTLLLSFPVSLEKPANLTAYDRICIPFHQD